MAEPQDSATTLLTTASNALRTVYRDSFDDMYGRFTQFNRIFTPSKRRIDGNGIVIQVQDKNMYGARMNTDINAAFPTPGTFNASSYTATLSETAGSNHFRRHALSLRTSWLDIQRVTNKEVAAVDYVAQLVSQSAANIDESMALHRQLPSTALLGTVNGTEKKNDNYVYADCGATAATGGARILVSGAAISAFPRGLKLDVYAAGGASRFPNGVMVTDFNPVDGSVGLVGLTSAGAEDSTSGLDAGLAPGGSDIRAIATTDELYISGEKDKGWIGPGAWFTEPATSGDSFFGRDRMAYSYRWLNPTHAGPTSSTQLSKTHIDAAALQIGYVSEDKGQAYMAVCPPDLEQRYRNEIGADVLLQFPTSEQKGELIAQYGFDGSMYRHPTLGRIMFQTDALAPTGQIRFYRLGDWEMLHVGSGAFEWLSDGGNAGWYRVTSATGGAGKTTFYQMDGMMAGCDICTKPRLQFRIKNVTA